MIDGTVARKIGTVSDFGSKLDTIADFILVIVCLIKLIPVLDFESWMYIWIGIIVIIKMINIISGFVVQKRFVPVHSVMNKIAGVLLFVLPLTVRIIDLRYSAAIVCSITTFAAIQEGHYIRSFKEKNIVEEETRSMQDSLYKLLKDKKGLANFFDNQKKEIIALIHDFPNTLDLNDQGRFFLGYYHQKNHREYKETEE
mgnify:CR=1 FL=1